MNRRLIIATGIPIAGIAAVLTAVQGGPDWLISLMGLVIATDVAALILVPKK
ncbi:hypothetical protein NQ036_03500 [Brevibacterium sp. 91QC2O2]|uniref:hypothetical protein n=1 Tax=Brevibacterium sp. 91QC2O2 TaxID=2968458 RepID=UPI00211CA70D|nr:hypothetical protein [Brevibacterium sp. 91QC2O2]MCQ9367312.1 hypothetical protein [Brevibacterium sp. 91QC2O2]